MKYILGSDSVTVFVQKKPYTVNRDSKIFSSVMKAIAAEDEDKVFDLVNLKDSFAKQSNGRVYIKDNAIFAGDREVTGLISSRIFEMLDLGLNVEPMFAFIDNLMKNPSNRAVNELYGFIDACNLPITEDGCFLAYKKVRGDYMDCHSGTIRNAIGDRPKMARNLVDEDKDRTCSHGLHFCSVEYLKHFGGERLMVLKINPADVVAIPSDYNNSKGRACEYEVVDEIELDGDKPKEELTIDYYVKNKEDIDGKPTNPYAKKMTREKAMELRRDFYAGASGTDLTEKYGISRRQVIRIIDGEAWL